MKVVHAYRVFVNERLTLTLVWVRLAAASS